MSLSKITEKTVVPLSLVVALLSLAIWITRIEAKAMDAQAKLSVLESIDRRLSRIEGRLRVNNGGRND